MNPFDVLEIASDASPEDIKVAYHRLAKRWHPDRFSGAEKTQAEEKFRELAEAFSILKDPGKRLTLLQQMPRPVAKPAQEARAPEPIPAAQERTPEDWAAMAKASFDEGRMDQARALIHYAIRLDAGKPQYHTLLATILEREGGDLRAVVKALETAVRLAPKDVESHIRLATHFHTLGMTARAQGHLQTAREIAPNHPKLRQPTPKAGGKGKAVAVQAPGSLMDQLKDLWGRLTGKGR
jgi:cytochrome c-type biogenesis protein CcmH/NrfG